MQPSSPNQPGCLAYGLFALAVAWICAVLALSAPAAWLVREVLVLSGGAWPWYVSPLVALAQALLIAAPVGLLAALTRAPGLRAAYLAWLLACLGLICLAPARGLPPAWTQAALLAQAAVALLLALALRLWGRRRPPTPEPTPPLAAGLAPALLLAGPWLIFGALGSPADTLLALLAGAALGALAAALAPVLEWGARAQHAAPLLPPAPLHALPPEAPAAPGAALLAGLALGVALLILAAGFGLGAANLLLMAALPPLGFAGAALARGPGRTRALAALVGGAAAAPLALFDPDEITLILSAHEIPQQALAAAGWAFLLALLAGAALGAAGAARLGLARRAPALAALGVSAVAAGLCYALLGHPGFYGERLFVILRDQADLSAAPAIAGREERLRFVYTTLTAHADAGQAEIRAALDRFGVAYTPYYLVNALEVDGGPLARAYLAGRPEVDRILESPRLRPLPAPPPPEPGLAAAPDAPAWNITSIGADRVWEELGVTGEGIVIGQSDSGADGEHPALREGYRGAGGQHDYNWLDPWYGAPAPRDYGQHGTHTLGSAAGRGGVGVAPGATWFACANLARNLGNPARYLDCMQFMLAPYAAGADPFSGGDPARAAHVLNNSWGCPPEEGCDAESLRPAVDALRAAGIFVVASAGNEGAACGSLDSPIAIYDGALTVGAVDELGEIADFSSRGPVTADGSGRTKPDIVAPGVDVLSAAPGGGYAVNSGTSMAGPHVAGVVALIWSANPDLIGDIEATERILLETASPYTGAGGLGCAGEPGASNVYGRGVVDAYAAVRAALELR